MSGDATASVTAALFGLDGFIVLGAADAGGELELLVETVAGPSLSNRNTYVSQYYSVLL